MANRQNFTRAVANEIAERAKNANGEPWCEICFCLTRKRELHHVAMDAMKRTEDKRKPLTARDGIMICEPCHDKITRGQVRDFNKAERSRAKHNGVVRRGPAIRSPGFAKTEPQNSARRPSKAIPFKPLFVSEDV